MNLQTEELSQDTLKLIFSGRLDINLVAKLWTTSLSIVENRKPETLILELGDVNYCDGSGIALIQTLQRKQQQNNRKVLLHNLNEKFQHLLDRVGNCPWGDKSSVLKTESEKFPEHLGYLTVGIIQELRSSVVFLGSFIYQLLLSFRHAKNIRLRDFWQVVETTGPAALPIIALIGFLVGLISTYQAEPSFAQFGVQIFLINLVGLGLVREMGPLMSAVLLSGRTASSFAAELGTMKFNQEIDALTTMGINPIRFLVLPRVLATVLVLPFLNVFLIAFGLLGCFVVMKTFGYPLDAFLHQLYSSIDVTDCIGGLTKSFVFGWVIAGVGCLNGLKAYLSSQAIGVVTTKAVVNSLVMLVIIDGIFAIVYHVLGI
jgi:phospholipid/cholesterol/gamma-HCH transport system permease protein